MKVLDGRPVPLFPLPNVVLYPRIVQPLHIFEPRYRAMLADVLDSHGKIAMALLKPGYEPQYHGSPDVFPVVSVGGLVTYETNEDGTSDIILLGECRARVVEELEGKIYRQATLVELTEHEPHAVADREALRARLKRWLRYAVEQDGDKKEGLAQLRKTLTKESNLGFLVDFLAFRYLKSSDLQRQVLSELDVGRRAETVLEHLGDR